MLLAVVTSGGREDEHQQGRNGGGLAVPNAGNERDPQ
jgi:hypothetical protein